MKTARATSIITMSIAVLCTHGCTVGPDYKPPTIDVPDKWHQKLSDGLETGESNIHTWWMMFKDPHLEHLIRKAVKGNKDLQVAFSRIQQSFAVLGIAFSQNAIDMDAVGAWQRERVSKGVMGIMLPPLSRTDNVMALGIDASWEIDVFGRIRRSVESASASLEGSVENYRDVLVILLAEVAATYVEVRTLQARIKFVNANITRQKATLKLTKDRLQAKTAPELDVRQAELNLARTESALPALRELLARAIHRLGVLLGEAPGAVYKLLQRPRAIPKLPQKVLMGIPRDLIRQRPDLRRAERDVAAQHARIGMAKADLYPRFSLFGSFAFEAGNDLFDASNQTWSFGPAFRWNLFDGNRIRNNVARQYVRTREAVLRYENAVLRAIEEVENAMVGYTEELKRREMLERSVKSAEQSVALARELYTTNKTDFQNVLDMERSLFQQQDRLAESEGRVVRQMIRLYKALGGGWNAKPDDKEKGKEKGKDEDKDKDKDKGEAKKKEPKAKTEPEK